MDFISQIEHDPDNIGIIATTSPKLIEYVEQNLEKFITEAKRKKIILKALKNSLLIKAKTKDELIRITNLISSEHLEIMTENPREFMKYVNNAGAIFLGAYSPVPLGDYSAGTNHILPTGGSARRYSGLNTFEFLKTIDVLECTKTGIENLKKSATKIARFEKLSAHKRAIEKRLD